MKFFAGFIVGILISIAVPLALIATGRIDMAATSKAGEMEERLGTMAWEKSMQHRAPAQKNPFENDPVALESGMDHYKENCVMCHGAPGVEGAELAKGLNPEAPELATPDVKSMTDGQVFYIIKNGIRMTGMPAFGPTHTDEEIWKIAVFVRNLDSLTDEQKKKLSEETQASEHHHHEEENQPQTAEHVHHHH